MADPIRIDSRLELMVDDHLIESLAGDARLVLHHPTPREVVIDHNAPWEGSGSSYHTVFQDGDLYRMYYRGAQFTVREGKLELEGEHEAVTCYAESRDGIHWEKPNLGLFEWNGSRENNIIWTNGRSAHNFAPFKDTRPGVPEDERYKALAGAPDGRGLAAFASPDGLRWRLLSDEPVITEGRFDSQNVAFWDEVRGEYRAYYRDVRDGYRDIRTATSQDFIHWSEGQWLDYGDAPGEHLYTNQIRPYDRALHLLVGIPTRYKERGWSDSTRALPDAEHRNLRAQVSERYGTAVTDALLMTSHDGRTFHRWDRAFMRPGPERPGTWNYGHLFTAWGILETPSPINGMANELSFYALEGGWTGRDAQLRRYTLRLDGFVSVQVGLPEGEMRTKPLIFEGSELVLNMATSAAGFVAVAIHDIDNNVIEGFGYQDCVPVFGDAIERKVTWQGDPDLSQLAGRPVRLRFIMKDADLYSLQFR